MTCERCNGLMVSEQICDLRGTSGDLSVVGYRCLLCGDVVDKTILANRRSSSETVEPPTVYSPPMPRLVAA